MADSERVPVARLPYGGDRVDFDAVAWWGLRNLGYGERTARDNARSQIQQARMREVETLDLVAREIVEAHAQVTARQKMIGIAEQGISSAQQSFDRNLARIRNVQGLPIEARSLGCIKMLEDRCEGWEAAPPDRPIGFR